MPNSRTTLVGSPALHAAARVQETFTALAVHAFGQREAQSDADRREVVAEDARRLAFGARRDVAAAAPLPRRRRLAGAALRLLLPPASSQVIWTRR